MTIVTKTTAYVLSLTQEQADILAQIAGGTVRWNSGKTGQLANKLFAELSDAGALASDAPELEYDEGSELFKEAE